MTIFNMSKLVNENKITNLRIKIQNFFRYNYNVH